MTGLVRTVVVSVADDAHRPGCPARSSTHVTLSGGAGTSDHVRCDDCGRWLR